MEDELRLSEEETLAARQQVEYLKSLPTSMSYQQVYNNNNSSLQESAENYTMRSAVKESQTVSLSRFASDNNEVPRAPEGTI